MADPRPSARFGADASREAKGWRSTPDVHRFEDPEDNVQPAPKKAGDHRVTACKTTCTKFGVVCWWELL